MATVTPEHRSNELLSKENIVHVGDGEGKDAMQNRKHDRFALSPIINIQPPSLSDVVQRLTDAGLPQKIPRVQNLIQQATEDNKERIVDGRSFARIIAESLTHHRQATAALVKTLLETNFKKHSLIGNSLIVDGKALRVSRLGDGATSEAWFAVSLSEEQHPMVLKIMKSRLQEDDTSRNIRERFMRETKLMQGLDGEVTPKLLCFGEIELDRPFAGLEAGLGELFLGQTGETQRPLTVPYLGMEYHSGHTLDEFVDHAKIFANFDVIVSIAMAVDHLHRKDIVHRDLKPANIHIGDDGIIRLLDLGMSVADCKSDETRLTQIDHVMGTPRYISPDQIVNPIRITKKADIYSLGCIICELLTGHAPYSAETVALLMSRHWDPNYEPRIEDIEDPEVRDFVRRMLIKVTCEADLHLAEKRPSGLEIAEFFYRRSSYAKRTETFAQFYALPAARRPLLHVPHLPQAEEDGIDLPSTASVDETIKSFNVAYPPITEDQKKPQDQLSEATDLKAAAAVKEVLGAEQHQRDKSLYLPGLKAVLAMTGVLGAAIMYKVSKDGADDVSLVPTAPAVAKIPEGAIPEKVLKADASQQEKPEIKTIRREQLAVDFLVDTKTQEIRDIKELKVFTKENQVPYVIDGDNCIRGWDKQKRLSILWFRLPKKEIEDLRLLLGCVETAPGKTNSWINSILYVDVNGEWIWRSDFVGFQTATEDAQEWNLFKTQNGMATSDLYANLPPWFSNAYADRLENVSDPKGALWLDLEKSATTPKQRLMNGVRHILTQSDLHQKRAQGTASPQSPAPAPGAQRAAQERDAVGSRK